MTWLFTVVLLFASGRDALTVHLADNHGDPLPGVSIALELYHFRGDRIEVSDPLMCTTDAAGECRFVLSHPPRDDAGFIRGTLTVSGYGRRSVLWPGGSFDVYLWLDPQEKYLEIPAESAPYEGQESVPTLPLVPAPRLRLADVLIPLLVVGVLLYLALKDKWK